MNNEAKKELLLPKRYLLVYDPKVFTEADLGKVQKSLADVNVSLSLLPSGMSHTGSYVLYDMDDIGKGGQ
jgi:hypothetical protein